MVSVFVDVAFLPGQIFCVFRTVFYFNNKKNPSMTNVPVMLTST